MSKDRQDGSTAIFKVFSRQLDRDELLLKRSCAHTGRVELPEQCLAILGAGTKSEVAALVAGVWSFTGTAPDGSPVTLTGHNADVLRRQADGSWRFVIDNPWGTD